MLTRSAIRWFKCKLKPPKNGAGEEIDEEEVTKEKKKQKMGDELSSSQFKKLWKNIKGMEMKNSEMELLASHLDEHTQGTLKSARTLINENIPKIHETFQVIYKFTLTLKKMLKAIPYKKDDTTGEPIIECAGCHLHCVSNWNLPGPSGQPTKDLPGSLL